MAPSNRSRPFHLTFEAGLAETEKTSTPSESIRKQPIQINSYAPIALENEYFKGRILVIHETGNEPELEDDAWEDDQQEMGNDRPLRGVELQLQGMFKSPIKLADGKTGLWISAEMKEPMSLGWMMQNIATLGVKFAKKKAEGNFYYSFGNRSELPHFAFPVSQVFMTCATPQGEDPPTLGRIQRSGVNWLPPGPLEVSCDKTYTFVSRTPYLDLCTWELLSVPGISPLPLEKLAGDITTSRLVFYDAGRAGSHADCRNASVLELVVRRAQQGEKWQAMPLSGAKTPLDEDSDQSEASDADEADDLVDVEGHVSDGSDESESGDDEELAEDDECLSRSESQLLSELDAWKPSALAATRIEEGHQVAVPYYIEAIDRRRKGRVMVWYVFVSSGADGSSDWWHAMAVPQLAPLCRRRPRMSRSFRRSTRVAVVKRYGAQSLETFRHGVCKDLSKQSARLRKALINVACSGIDANQLGDHDVVRETDDHAPVKERPSLKVPYASNVKLPSVPLPSEMKKRMKKRIFKRPLLPPLYFDATGSRACTLAFTHAREGRGDMIQEGFVGALHFEGRVCEELLRISDDGVLRCFSPYDCERPRLRIQKEHILRVSSCKSSFLGRFYSWELHTQLRVYNFCCAEESARDNWVDKITELISANPLNAKWLVLSDMASHLTDSSKAQRWQAGKRVVLNDRRLLRSGAESPKADIAEGLLHWLLAMPENPIQEDVLNFADATCKLKAVRFAGWSQDDLLAFWINLYHCLLLHGRLVLGTPKSVNEWTRFRGRVSYIVGLMPVSLEDIEQHILRVPTSDAIAVNAMTSRAKKGQAQALGAVSSANSWAHNLFSHIPLFFGGKETQKEDSQEKSKDEEDVGNHTSSLFPKWFFDGGGFFQAKCLPLPTGVHVPISMPALPWRRKSSPCLFLGYVPDKGAEGYKLQKRDLRVAIALNRGNLESLAAVPIFQVASLSSQLDEVARAFVAHFAEVRISESGVSRLVLPQRCRGVWRELQRSPASLIRFIWQFMPQENGGPPERLQVTFRKNVNGPRCRSEMYLLKSELSSQSAPWPQLAAWDIDLAFAAANLDSAAQQSNSLEILGSDIRGTFTIVQI